MKIIVKNLYQRITQEKTWGAFFDNTISSEVVMELCQHHPRKARKLLEQSFGHAAFEKRSYLITKDIQECLKEEVKLIQIGFM